MNQKILNIIEEELFQDNIDTKLEANLIYWKDNFGAENEVRIDQIAINKNRIAWWQNNEVGKELVRIKINDDTIINWRPPINTMGLSSMGCDFIEFYLEFLIIKYQDKHRERVFIIDTNNILTEEIQTSGYRKKIKLVDNKLFLQEQPNGQITMTSIQTGNINTGIISNSYLMERNIDL